MSRSSRIEERSSSSSWKRLLRSNSVMLSSEIDPDTSVGAGYQRLSRSVRDSGEDFNSGELPAKKRGSGGNWREKVGKIFSFRGISGRAKVAAPPSELVVGKKRSSWLPDPNRRWPVQGW